MQLRSIPPLIAIATAMLAAPASAESLQKLQGDGFSVQMPGTAEKQARNFRIAGGDLVTQSWTVNDDGSVYAVTTADFPQKMVDARPASEFLTEAIDGLARQLHGSVASRKAMTLAGRPATEAMIPSDNGEAKARAVMVGRRLYTLLVLYNASNVAPQRDGFLQSFKLDR